ncbi:hypothetical protein CLV88_103129 [Shimia abyssi]|uniref:Uncharacterized protein n=1 Tax=Shimia abyssi TaxID=1662395 RepID=A0A2P8FFJ8_9RHOB|nr:hypothetical protein CLV88_103129 [Shimia abyssi]
MRATLVYLLKPLWATFLKLLVILLLALILLIALGDARCGAVVRSTGLFITLCLLVSSIPGLRLAGTL